MPLPPEQSSISVTLPHPTSRQQTRIAPRTCAAGSEETSSRSGHLTRLDPHHPTHPVSRHTRQHTLAPPTDEKLAILSIYPSLFRRRQPQPSSTAGIHPRNTANLTSTLLSRTGLTFAEGVKASPPPSRSGPSARASLSALQRSPSREMGVAEEPPPPLVVQSAERKMSFAQQDKDRRKSRRRRSSSLMFQEPPESLEQQSDQAVLPNLNSQWVNAKGRIVLIQEAYTNQDC